MSEDKEKEEEVKEGQISSSKKTNIVTWIIIVILIVLLAGCGYLLIQERSKNKELNGKEKNNTIATKKEEPIQEEKIEELELTDSLVVDATKIIPKHLCGGVAIKLEKEDRTIEEFTNQEKLDMIASIYEDNIIKTAADGSKYTFTENELKKYFEDLSFLDAYKPSTMAFTIYPAKLTFDNGDIIATSFGTGCEGPGNNGNILKIESAKKTDETLVINYLQYYRKYDFDDDAGDFVAKIYKTEDDKETVAKTVDVSKYQFDKDKFNHYSFIYNIKDGNLQLQKVEFIESKN